jgi:hypothetical protein
MLPGRDDQLINLKTPLLLPSSPEQSIGGRFIFKWNRSDQTAGELRVA